MCTPTKFTEPAVAGATPYCEQADNETAMVYPCLSFPVLTVGLLWWTHAPSCMCPQLQPRTHSRPFGMSPFGQTESSPWICLLKLKFQHWSLSTLSGQQASSGTLLKFPICPRRLVGKGDSQGEGTFPLSQFPTRDAPIPIPFLPFPFLLPGYMGIFLAALVVWDLLQAFSRYSVRIVLHVDVFLMYLWKELSSTS